jgi:hypothetical protein
MPVPTDVAEEIARLMRDPDALRHERERMPSFGRRGHYDPNQPRVDAGHSDGGQWTRAGTTGIDFESDQPRLARFAPNRPLVRPTPTGPAPTGPGAIGVLLSLFAALSARNSPSQRTIFDFNAKEFLRNPNGELNRADVRMLNREEVDNVCRKLDDVQQRTDIAANDARADGLAGNPQEFGTAVHTRVASSINGPDRRRPRDPNYRAEVSYWKMAEDRVSGRLGSIRIDVLERTGGDVVCVYDLKTGQNRRNVLTRTRMLEIAKHVMGAYPDAKRIIITEVRPSK